MNVRIVGMVGVLGGLILTGLFLNARVVQRVPANAQTVESIAPSPISTVVATFNEENGKSSVSTELTEKEEEELRMLIPQTLRWLSVWEIDSACLRNKTDPSSAYRTFGKADRFSEIYKRFEGKNITVRISPGEQFVDTYIVEMKTHIKFAREKNQGIFANEPERLCTLPDEIENYQLRNYVIPVPEKKSKSMLAWSKEKAELFGEMMKVVRANACSSLAYERGKRIKITVPDFEIGVPRIDILLTSEGNEPVNAGMWIDFSHGDPEFVKNYGFPDKELIRKNAVYISQIECAEN